MASSSKREGGELETLADEVPQAVDGPSAVGVVAFRRGTAVLAVHAVAVLAVAAIAVGVVGDNVAIVRVAVASVAGASLFVSLLSTAGGRNAGLLPGASGAVLLRGAAGLLPRWAACRYREEWAGELYDLCAEGAPWWRRVGYILGILLCGAPRLAVGLRLGGERSRA